MRNNDPELINDETIYAGKRVTLIKRLLRVKGSVVAREVVRFGEAAAALPILPDGKVILIKQFRAPINRWVLEIPAGVVEPGEFPEETIKRELVEEIGYESGSLKKLFSVHTTPGYSDEVLHIYVAEDLKYVGARPEKYEVIETVVFNDFDEALNAVLSEPVTDAKTLLALLALKTGITDPQAKHLKPCE